MVEIKSFAAQPQPSTRKASNSDYPICSPPTYPIFQWDPCLNAFCPSQKAENIELPRSQENQLLGTFNPRPIPQIKPGSNGLLPPQGKQPSRLFPASPKVLFSLGSNGFLPSQDKQLSGALCPPLKAQNQSSNDGLPPSQGNQLPGTTGLAALSQSSEKKIYKEKEEYLLAEISHYASQNHKLKIENEMYEEKEEYLLSEMAHIAAKPHGIDFTRLSHLEKTNEELLKRVHQLEEDKERMNKEKSFDLLAEEKLDSQMRSDELLAAVNELRMKLEGSSEWHASHKSRSEMLAEIDKLRAEIDCLTLERVAFQKDLTNKDGELATMSMTIETLKKNELESRRMVEKLSTECCYLKEQKKAREQLFNLLLGENKKMSLTKCRHLMEEKKAGEGLLVLLLDENEKLRVQHKRLVAERVEVKRQLEWVNSYFDSMLRMDEEHGMDRSTSSSNTASRANA